METVYATDRSPYSQCAAGMHSVSETYAAATLTDIHCGVSYRCIHDTTSRYLSDLLSA